MQRQISNPLRWLGAPSPRPPAFCSTSAVEKQTHRGPGSPRGSHTVSEAEHRPEPGLQAQCSLPRRWGAQDTSLNHRVKFRRRRKNAAAGGVPRAGALPSRSRGSGRAGMTQPRPEAVSGAPFAGNLPAEAARTAEALGGTAEPAAGGHSGAQDPLSLSPQRDPTHIHTQASTQALQTQSAWVGGRSLLSREGVSLEQGNPGRPMRGGGHEQQSRPSCRLGPRSEAADTASSLPPLRRPPSSLQPRRRRPLCVLKAFSRIIAQRRLRLALRIFPAYRRNSRGPRTGRGCQARSHFHPERLSVTLGIRRIWLMGGRSRFCSAREGHWPPAPW